MKLVCISDNHLRSFQIPSGDALLHTGDLTFDGSLKQVSEGFKKLSKCFNESDFRYMLFCPGNHDFLFQTNPEVAKQIANNYGWTVLHQKSIIIDGLVFYGSAT